MKRWSCDEKMVVEMPMIWHERILAQLSEWTNEPTNQSVNESMKQQSNDSMNQATSEPMNRSISETTTQWINGSASQWINESMNHWISEPRNQWINEWRNLADVIFQRCSIALSFLRFYVKPSCRYSLVHILRTSSSKSVPIPSVYFVISMWNWALATVSFTSSKSVLRTSVL